MDHIVVHDQDHVAVVLRDYEKGESIQLEGMYPGYEGVYRYPLNLDELP